jgi:hypothetical protein
VTAPTGPRRVVVIGAVGRAGRAVIRERLGAVGGPPVVVLCTRPFAHVPQGLQQALVQGHHGSDGLPHVNASDEVVIVIETPRHQREAVFWCPPRHALGPLVQALHAQGVRRLECVPGAGHGVSTTEAALLQRLGFTVREPRSGHAQRAATGPARSAPERLAAWLLHTLISTLHALGMQAGAPKKTGRGPNANR